MSERTKRVVLICASLAVVVIVIGAYLGLTSTDPPPPVEEAAGTPALTAQEVGAAFVAAWSRGDHAAAAAQTDQPTSAASALTEAREALKPVSFTAALAGKVTETGHEATASATVSWTLDEGRTWSYATAITLFKPDGEWAVRWAPVIVHPKMTAGLSLARKAPVDVSVVDRDGKPLVRGGASLPAAGPILGPGMVRVAAGRAQGEDAVVLVDGAGKEKARLLKPAEDAGRPLRSTVDSGVQSAAQAAVDSVKRPAYLVAIDAPTGGILAVAQNAATQGNPRALNGLFPPGSTFKVVTATAAMAAGAGTDTTLPCPGETTIGPRTIRNDGFSLGEVPLRTAFARSCNTTFATVAADLPADALPVAASRFGLAADFDIPGITTETGKVPAAESTPQQVENAIGQGTVQASPFGLALMTATVARGSAVTPQLYSNLKTRVNDGYSGPSSGTLSALRSMMRAVVTSGTASALAGYGSVAGKTGTAQFGDGTNSHGWFAGYRGDVAFAVLVEAAGSSGPAVSVSGNFLGGI